MNVSQVVLVSALVISAITAVTFGVIKLASAGSIRACGGGCFNKTHWEAGGDEGRLSALKQTCKEKSREKFALGVADVAERLELKQSRVAQYQAWLTLKAALQTEQNTVDYMCEKIFNPDSLADFPARLELLESLMLTGVETVQRIRPLFNSFYDTLDQAQQTELEGLMAKHHRGRHRFFH